MWDSLSVSCGIPHIYRITEYGLPVWFGSTIFITHQFESGYLVLSVFKIYVVNLDV